MLFSWVDDRSDVAYQKYHCVYDEDAESVIADIKLPRNTVREYLRGETSPALSGTSTAPGQARSL